MSEIKCRRVYPNGDSVVDVRSRRAGATPNLQGWFEYNRLFRPGTALLVGGAVDTLGIGFHESDRARLEQLYAADKPPVLIAKGEVEHGTEG